MMGLRVADGIDTMRFEQLAGYPLPDHKITDLVDMGLIEHIDTRIRLTNQGFSLLNGVLRLLLAD